MLPITSGDFRRNKMTTPFSESKTNNNVESSVFALVQSYAFFSLSLFLVLTSGLFPLSPTSSVLCYSVCVCVCVCVFCWLFTCCSPVKVNVCNGSQYWWKGVMMLSPKRHAGKYQFAFKRKQETIIPSYFV